MYIFIITGHLLTHRRVHEDASEEASSVETQTETEECLTVTTDSSNKCIKVELETIERTEQRYVIVETKWLIASSSTAGMKPEIPEAHIFLILR